VERIARITYNDTDGVESVVVNAGKISESDKVRGVRIQREDGSYLHLPGAQLYAIEISEKGKVDYSGS